jgi:hypothetical protein
MTKDLIIGAYTNYNWDQIKFWANSIDKCGFTGDKAVLVYNSDITTVDKLKSLRFKVISFNQDPISKNYYFPGTNLIIVVERFYHLWNFFDIHTSDLDYRYVITTDMKDVVFQTNPSIWLENNIGDKDIVASCESVRYKDEPWGNDNLQGSYPMAYEKLKENPIWNCGVQAGKSNVIKDLWFQIWLTCKAGQRYNPDQAAYNLLLNSYPWKKITKFSMGEDAWACQAGTQVDPAKLPIFGNKLLEPMPIWEDGMSKTTDHVPHAILHQWDRIPNWKTEVEKKYG